MIVRKNLFEKFTEDSDPIADMGIGMEKVVDTFFNLIGENRKDKTIEEQILKAIHWNKIDIVQYLLKQIKNINYNNGAFLEKAASTNRFEIVKLLLEKGANLSYPALYQAAGRGYINIVQLFIDHGIDITAENNKALRTAVVNNKLNSVKLLLENGADIHVNNERCLKESVERGYTEIVKLLLSYGADPTINDNEIVEWADILGMTEILKILKNHINQ